MKWIRDLFHEMNHWFILQTNSHCKTLNSFIFKLKTSEMNKNTFIGTDVKDFLGSWNGSLAFPLLMVICSLDLFISLCYSQYSWNTPYTIISWELYYIKVPSNNKCWHHLCNTIQQRPSKIIISVSGWS